MIICPETGQLFWADFSALDRCAEAGRLAFDKQSWDILKKGALRRTLTLRGLIHPARLGEWRHPFSIF